MQGNKLLNAFKKLHIVDISLLIFLFILLCQSGYSIIFHKQDNPFDVIVRTTSASIFGYFLSTRFANNIKKSETNAISTNIIEGMENSNMSLQIQNKIGFSEDTADISGNIQTISNDDVSANDTLQIIIISGIGLFSLILLIILRNIDLWQNNSMPLTNSALSTVSQLRDFVSACVGFLIGYPQSK